MIEFPFKKIDAFATKKSTGNPAGYIKLNSLTDISEQKMLQIAKELKGFVNEVGYVAQTNENEFELRYYSSEKEVDFCGHATIAIFYDLINTNDKLRKFSTLKINTNKGKLIVYNEIETENAVFTMSPDPEFYNTVPDIQNIALNLNIDIKQIDSKFPISIINAGLTTLIVPIKDLESILNIKPEIKQLKSFCINSNIDIIEVFTSDVYHKSSNCRTRVFAPTFGYLEDPATGSGNSAFGYYLNKNNMWKNEIITIEQNGLKENFNIVKLRKQTDNTGKTKVCFGGNAITRIEGIYSLL